MATKKRNVRLDDALWNQLAKEAARHRRSVAGEIRVALEVYAALSAQDDQAIDRVLNQSTPA